MHDDHAVEAFLSRISEKARHLKARESELPPYLRSLAANAVHDLEQSAEELRVTNEELKLQHELLFSSNAVVQVERARFHRLFDLGPDPCIVTDIQGGIVECNRACARLLDRERALLNGKPLAALLATDSVPPFRAALARLARLEEVKEVELCLAQRTGDTIPVTIRAAQLPATPDEEARIVWSLRDQSDRQDLVAARDELAKERISRELAEAVNAQAAYLAEAAAQLSGETDGVRIAETAARLAVERYAECSIVYLLAEDGSIFRAAVAHRDREQERDLRESLRRAGTDSVQSQAVIALLEGARSRPGEPLDLSPLLAVLDSASPGFFLGNPGTTALAVPLTARGQTFGLRLATTNTDELAIARSLMQAAAGYSAMALSTSRLLSEARRRRKEAEEVSRGRARAMSGLSHELRTPLHSILGYCELLIDGVEGSLSEKSKRFIGAIRSSAQHQAGLVDDVLALSKPPGQGVQISPSDVSLAELAHEVRAMVADRARARGIEVRVDVPESLSLFTDRSKLLQILINLVVNGVKFTDKGHVAIEASSRNDKVSLVVRDTGRGITPTELPYVFDAFWQGSASEKAGGEGAGLGLALVRRLVDTLGGEIEIDSREGIGSTFSVRLPVEAPPSGAIAPRQRRSERLPAH